MIYEEPRKTTSDKGSFYLITGVVIGLVLGLIFSLVVMPVRYKDAGPSMLNTEGKERYRIVVSMAYLANGDLGRARSRLSLLQDVNMYEALNEQGYARLGEADGGGLEAEALKLLAAQINPLMVPLPTEAPPELEEETAPAEDAEEEETSMSMPPTATAEIAGMVQNTPTPGTEAVDAEERPTAQPTSTMIASLNKPFRLEERLDLCDRSLPPRLIQVSVEDEDGMAVSSVPIQISWTSGAETFFTGFFPDLGDGYADFQMSEEETYRLQVGQAGEMVDNLSAPTCTLDDGTTFDGGWYLAFRP